MPKVTFSSYPVSALFGVVKPSGPTSMNIVTEIQDLVARSKLFVEPQKLKRLKSDVAQGKKIKGKRLRELVKVGQGGTLDPLADGVLGNYLLHSHEHSLRPTSVVGVGKGTKKLSQFLECTKVSPRVLSLLAFDYCRNTKRPACWDVKLIHTMEQAQSFAEHRGNTLHQRM